MGSLSRKEKEKEVKKNDIIDTAEKLFFERGYESVTMDDVASAAEFSKRTIYVYFNSKEQIYFEVMVRGYRLLLEIINRDLITREKGNSIVRIRNLGEILYQFYIEYPKYFEAIMEYENSAMDFQSGISDSSREECYKLGEKILAFLMEALEQGQVEGDVKEELNVTRTALILWSCMLGTFNVAEKKKNYISYYHNTTSKELITEAYKFIIDAIKKN